MGGRRKHALTRHRENTLRNWERCAKSRREEAVAQLFERIMEKAIAVLDSGAINEEDSASMDEDKVGSLGNKVIPNKTGNENGNKENKNSNLIFHEIQTDKGKSKPLARSRSSKETPNLMTR